jgi:hypothetical protein
MTSIYNEMASHPHFPEHLVETIARRVHQIHFQSTLYALESRLSSFERLIYDASTLNDWVVALKDAYPTLEICGDFFHGFRTVVLKLSECDFVAFHHYDDLECGADILMEGHCNQGIYTVTKCFIQNPYTTEPGKHTLPFSTNHWMGLLLRTIDPVMNPSAFPLVIHPNNTQPSQRWQKHHWLIHYLDSRDFRPYISQITI